MIGRSNNMFRKWSFEINQYAKPGLNDIILRFDSPVNTHKNNYKNAPYRLPAENDTGEIPISPYTRKAPFQFGWDWGPRLVSVGLWKKVELIKHQGLEVMDMYIEQLSIDTSTAHINIHYSINNTPSKTIDIQTIIDQDTFSFRYNKQVKDTSSTLQITQAICILKPKLWWTHDHGTPTITTINSIISSGADTIVETKEIGLCSIEFIHQKDSLGTSFYFRLNGRPIFIKGANYIPQHSLPSTLTDNQYIDLIDNAQEAHFNMLRVWGGGIYEKDIFYKTCLQKGILIWQDFMFACSLYPGDSLFIQNVKKEVIDNVARLRNYPNIALWCGNNEIDVAWHNWGWQSKYGYNQQHEKTIWDHYSTLFHQIIPDLVDSLCNIPYVSTSPISNWENQKISIIQVCITGVSGMVRNPLKIIEKMWVGL